MLEAYAPDVRDQMRVRHHLFIRERDQGHAYNMTDAEAAEAFPWLQDYWATFGPFFAQPPGGESLAQVCERVYTFLQKLARTMEGKRILLVTHGGTIWCARYVLERWTYEEAERRFQTEHIRQPAVARRSCRGRRLVAGGFGDALRLAATPHARPAPGAGAHRDVGACGPALSRGSRGGHRNV